jgi:hypothetical protein
MECSCSSRHHGVDASTAAQTPTTINGPRVCSHRGLQSAIAAQIASPTNGMANCRFCQKSKLIDRTLMKCGWVQ